MHDPQPVWDDFRVFLAALRSKSFSAAARMLAMEQSTVSRRIGRLEASLGVVLFERRRDGLVPTEAAETLQPEAEAAETSFHRLIATSDSLTTEVDGVVRVSVTESMADQVIIPSLHRIIHTYPNLRIQLLTGIELSNIEKGETDISLRSIPINHQDFISVKLCKLHLAIVGARQYLANRVYSTPHDLDWIGLVPPAGTELPETRWTNKYTPPPRLAVSNFVSQERAIYQQLGVGLITKESLLLHPELVEIEFDLPAPPSFELWLVTHRRLRMVPRVRVVIDFIKQLACELLASKGSSDEIYSEDH